MVGTNGTFIVKILKNKTKVKLKMAVTQIQN